MKRKLATIAAIALAFTLAACATQAEPAPAVTVTETATAEPEAAEVATEATLEDASESTEPDLAKMCQIAIGKMDDDSPLNQIPGLLIDLPNGLNDETVLPYLDVNKDLLDALEYAPAHLRAALEDIRTPFAVIAEVAAGGGGEIAADSSSVGDGIRDVMGACADSGYRVDE